MDSSKDFINCFISIPFKLLGIPHIKNRQVIKIKGIRYFRLTIFVLFSIIIRVLFYKLGSCYLFYFASRLFCRVKQSCHFFIR